jgi:hypothetical protein
MSDSCDHSSWDSYKKCKAVRTEPVESFISTKKQRIKVSAVDPFKALLRCMEKNSLVLNRREDHKGVTEPDAVFRKLEGLFHEKFNAERLKSNTDWKAFMVRILKVIDMMSPKTCLRKASMISENYKEIPQLLVSGPPQSGKTSWIAMLGISAKQKKICTFVLTTTTDLCRKISEDLDKIHFSPFPEIDRPTCIYIGCKDAPDSRSNQDIKRCLLDHGVIVVNFHAMSIKQLLSMVCELRGYGNACKFVLVKDQSDVLHHETGTDRHLHLARLEGRELLEHGYFGCPLLTLNVTSRPLPVLLRLHAEQGRVLGMDDWYQTAPGAGYVGLDRMKPFLGSCLLDGELTRRNGFWSQSVDALYADAHPARPREQRPGVLVIDGASRLVRTRDSIKRRAESLQARCPRFAAVLLWGAGGCAVRYPGGGWIEGEELARVVARCLALREGAQASSSDSECSLLDLLRQDPTTPPVPAGGGPRAGRGGGPAPVTAAQLLACVDPPPGAGALAAALMRPVVVMGSSHFLGESLASAVRAPTHLLCPARPAGAPGSALGWGMSYGGGLLRGPVLVLATPADWAAAAAPAREIEALRIALGAAAAAGGGSGSVGAGQALASGATGWGEARLLQPEVCDTPESLAACLPARRRTGGLRHRRRRHHAPVLSPELLSGPADADRDCTLVDLTHSEEAGLPRGQARVPLDSGCSLVVDLTLDEGRPPPLGQLVVDLSGQQLVVDLSGQQMVVDLSGDPD